MEVSTWWSTPALLSPWQRWWHHVDGVFVPVPRHAHRVVVDGRPFLLHTTSDYHYQRTQYHRPSTAPPTTMWWHNHHYHDDCDAAGMITMTSALSTVTTATQGGMTGDTTAVTTTTTETAEMTTPSQLPPALSITAIDIDIIGAYVLLEQYDPGVHVLELCSRSLKSAFGPPYNGDKKRGETEKTRHETTKRGAQRTKNAAQINIIPAAYLAQNGPGGRPPAHFVQGCRRDSKR
ncbi:hypothetical protein HD554DRAFT_2044110 [Boletus coccyginus]|nr:hypothetical protein HD554DRAFT_2044110 [Boletus coccyginus]